MKARALIAGHDAAFAAWAAARLDHVGPQGFGQCRAIGVATGDTAVDRLLAVVVFHDFQARAQTVQISCASVSPMWAHPDTLRDLLAIPFGWMDADGNPACFKVWVAIPLTNARAIRFNEHALGMRREAVIRHQFGPKAHAVILGMTRHEWARKWKEGRHGQERFAAAAAA